MACYKHERALCYVFNDLNPENDLECLLIPSNEQIETVYEAYADEITKPLDFDMEV